MKKPSLVFLFMITCALCSAPEFARCGQQASPPAKVESAPDKRIVITIGDEKITAAEVGDFIEALPPQYRDFYGGPGKHLLPQYIIAMKVLSAEAAKLKLAEQPEVARAIEIAREGILSDATRRHLAQDISVSDQEMRELYEKDKTQSEEVRVGRILIRTEDAVLKSGDSGHGALPEAEARNKLEGIRKRILAGASFAQMAKQYSEDTSSAASGGDIGYIQHDDVLPPIANAAYSLQPGQVSDILKTPYGLEIIRVEEKHTKPFDEVKPALESQVKQAKLRERVQRLVDQYKVAVDEQFFASQPTMQTPPAPTPSH